MPAGSIPENSDLARATLAACGHEGPCGKVSYITEAALFQRAGIPAVICGPGSINQAHMADEYIEATQLDACDAFLARLLLPEGAE